MQYEVMTSATMRKHSARKIRPASKLLTPEKHERLMLTPRLCLTLLLQGTAQRIHVETILSIFNIGISLAKLSGQRAMQNNYQHAQELLCSAARGPEPLCSPEADLDFLKKAFNQLDRYIGIQHEHKVARALDFIDHAIQTGEGAKIIPIPKGPEDERIAALEAPLSETI
jgi:hypothetical protein